MTNRRRRSLARKQQGFLLIALLALLAMGALYFFLSNISPELIQARRQQQTNAALTQARDALIGYAVRFREDQLKTGTSGLVYGYLPLPDLGSSRNNNVGCAEEGCDAANFTGNAPNITTIGRFPWRTLGTGPLRDSNGECLWYAVSGNHQRIQRSSLMNWDTLSQLDVVVANGTAAMISAVTSAHDRPIAVIFSPGPPLAGQNRGVSAADSVAECGGNYVVTNYLDPVLATDLGGITNYLTNTNSASGDTSATNKSLSAGGTINRRGDGTLWVGNCPPNDTSACTIAANDTGAAITSELLFRTLRGSSYFRTDINSMLDRMTTCLRDQIAASSGFTPDPLSNFTPPADKNAGRVPNSTCYDDTQDPLGYFSHYKDQTFVAQPTSGNFAITVDSAAQTCAATVIFGDQRGAGQSRGTTAERNTPANYLEGVNLTGFTTIGASSFAGPSSFAQVSASQIASQDIVRCIPPGPSLTQVAAANLAPYGQITAYDPGSQTLTLGRLYSLSNAVRTSLASSFYGCNWSPETHLMGGGLRSYFKFRISDTGEGFTFAIVDGANSSSACGAARQHLGYSGNNTFTPPIAAPKIGIEIDTSTEAGFTPANNTLSNGRNDPNYTGGHVGIVYWGGEAPILASNTCTFSCTAPKYCSAGRCYLPATEDDNLHGYPPATGTCPIPPQNPAAPTTPTLSAGVYKLDPSLSQTPVNQDIHVRVEVTRNATTTARVATTTNLNLSSPGASIDGVTLASGDRVLVKTQTVATANGIYVWNGSAAAMTRATDADSASELNSLRVTVQSGSLANTTFRQTAAITTLGTNNVIWCQVETLATARVATIADLVLSSPGASIDGIALTIGDRVLVKAQTLSANNGVYIWNGPTVAMTRATDADTANELNSARVTISAGSLANTTWLQSATISVLNVDTVSWQVGTNYLVQAWILADSPTVANQITAMKTTTRPMSVLYPTFAAHLRDTPLIYYPFLTARTGFTVSQSGSSSARDQIINISNFFTTWIE